jgi:hypothetical protein
VYPLHCAKLYYSTGDLYLISKGGSDKGYGTGTGFTFVPHNTITCATDAAISTHPHTEIDRGTDTHKPAVGIEEASDSTLLQQQVPLSSSEEMTHHHHQDNEPASTQQVQPVQMEEKENKCYHMTVIPGSDNPDHGKFICLINSTAT